MKQNLCLIGLLCAGLSVRTAAPAVTLYWVADCSHGIYQGTPGTADLCTRLTTINENISDLAADCAGTYVYWAASSGYGTIGRIDTATGISEILVPPNTAETLKYFRDLVLDEQNNKIYFSGYRTSTLYSANPDGSDYQVVFSRPELSLFPTAFDIDFDAGAIYYNFQGIRRVNLDGTQDELVFGNTGALDMHLDSAAGKIFWTNSNWLMSANLDGSGITVLFDPDYKIKSFTLDRVHRTIYWKSEIPLISVPQDTQTYIHCCSYEGTDMQTLFYLGDGLCPVNGDLTAVPEPAAGGLLAIGAWLSFTTARKIKHDSKKGRN